MDVEEPSSVLTATDDDVTDDELREAEVECVCRGRFAGFPVVPSSLEASESAGVTR